jgi:hypothetical protein
VGQLAPGGKHAASGSTECAHHAIWIPVAVVWGRGDAAKCDKDGPAVAVCLAADEKGLDPVYPLCYHCLPC